MSNRVVIERTATDLYAIYIEDGDGQRVRSFGSVFEDTIRKARITALMVSDERGGITIKEKR